MSAFREPRRKLSWDELRAIQDEVDAVMAALAVRGGGWIGDVFAADWQTIVLGYYDMLRGDLTDEQWQRRVTEARATLAHAEALGQALEKHETLLDVRTTALGGPLA